jgi:hypothetical protein
LDRVGAILSESSAALPGSENAPFGNHLLSVCGSVEPAASSLYTPAGVRYPMVRIRRRIRFRFTELSCQTSIRLDL